MEYAIWWITEDSQTITGELLPYKGNVRYEKDYNSDDIYCTINVNGKSNTEITQGDNARHEISYALYRDKILNVETLPSGVIVTAICGDNRNEEPSKWLIESKLGEFLLTRHSTVFDPKVEWRIANIKTLECEIIEATNEKDAVYKFFNERNQ